MTYPGPVPPQQRSHTVRTILIIVGIVLVLCCGGAIAGGVVLFKSVQSATGPARDTVDTFLNQLAAGETDAAYENLCAAAREQFTAEQFAQIVNGRPKITQHSIVGTNVVNSNGQVSASVNAEIRYADGSTDTHLFRLRKESGTWRVCGQPY
jgi:Domain of unknown function (DUF4878)